MRTSIKQGANLSSSSQLSLEYCKLTCHNIPMKMKSWIYKSYWVIANGGYDDVTMLAKNICNVVDHWIENHSTCVENRFF